MKLMFALWGGDLGGLHEAEFRDRLEDIGVHRLQLNLRDEHVERAMRISELDPPIDGFASIWTTSDPAPIVAALLDLPVDRVAGWEVEERRPIDPPEQWDGSRLDALANIAVIRRPAELTQEEWLRRWRGDHTPIAIATQATFGYLQNLVVRRLTEGTPEVSGIVEELFPSAGIEDMHAFYGSDGDDAELKSRLDRLMASVARIGADRDLDLVPTSRYLYDVRSEGAPR
jgi:hypothetical protein